MNKACLVGRMTRDPELRYTDSNKAVVSFTIAINRTFKNGQGEYDADFINVVAWGQAESINKYTSKGSLVSVEGRIQSRSYEAKDGSKRYITEVIADSVQFLDNKKEENSQEVQKEEPKEKEEDPFETFGNQIAIDDDDLPF